MTDALGVRRGERETLSGTLDWYRAVVGHKVDGLDLERAGRIMTPTGVSLLGVIRHLAWVERGWFQQIFAGEDVESVDSEEDNSEEFAIHSEDTTASVIGFYPHEIDRSREVAARSSLDDLSARMARFDERVCLRWILVHMIEETARRAGHMDIMRELIDGRTGD